MKRFTRFFIAGILAAMLVISTTFSSYAVTYKTYGRSSMVSSEMYNAMIETLRAHADPSTAGQLYDTGIVCCEDDFLQIDIAIDKMFLGCNDILIMCNASGRSNLSIQSVSCTGNNTHVDIYCNGGSHPTQTIYVGFYPGTDPAELMRQHDVAYENLVQAVAAAPEGDYEFYSYCYDYVKGLGSYDYSLSKESHCVYGLVADRKGVCQAFTAAFLMMCWLKGRECLFMELDNRTHGAALFQSGGTYYKADFTKHNSIIPASDELTAFVTAPFFE